MIGQKVHDHKKLIDEILLSLEQGRVLEALAFRTLRLTTIWIRIMKWFASIMNSFLSQQNIYVETLAFTISRYI